jgi:hypothetical protein
MTAIALQQAPGCAGPTLQLGLCALLAPMPHAQNDDLIRFGKKSVPSDVR